MPPTPAPPCQTAFGQMIDAYQVDLVSLARRTFMPLSLLQRLCEDQPALDELSSFHFFTLRYVLGFHSDENFYDSIYPPEVPEVIEPVPPVAPARIGFDVHPIRMGYERVQHRMRMLIEREPDGFTQEPQR